GQGGGIFANGSTLTLKNNLLGQIVTRSKNSTNKTSKSTFTGNPNSALGGAGGVGQGGGLYVSGGTVNVTNDRIWDNQVKGAIGAAGSAGGNAQGGGIYANATTLSVTGGSVDANGLSAGAGGVGTANHPAGFAGGNAQGGGIYANTTKLSVSGA